MSIPVSGDPASCSLVGAALRQVAARMRTTGRGAHDAFDTRGGPRPSTVEVHARRRVDVVDAAAALAARELDLVGAALQHHASDLAEAVAASRQLSARAEAAGLRVADGAVAPAWGVAGVADPGASAAREGTQTTLQAELDRVSSLLAQRRQRLTAALTESRESLAHHAAALRR